jgi:hypothetical protein
MKRRCDYRASRLLARGANQKEASETWQKREGKRGKARPSRALDLRSR